MTTIPQIACAMHEILTTTANAAARTTRFVQRTSPLSGRPSARPWCLAFSVIPRRPWKTSPKRQPL